MRIPIASPFLVLLMICVAGDLAGEVYRAGARSAGAFASPERPEVLRGNTAICPGGSAQLEIAFEEGTIAWIEGAETLSCDDCPDPVATPDQTTTYRAVVTTPFLTDTLDITVSIFGLDAGPDRTVCRGETFQIVAADDAPNAAFAWTSDPDAGLTFSCTDCPDPLITAETPGTYELSVAFAPDEGDCAATDQVSITVLDAPAPVYTLPVREEGICEGASVVIGVSSFEGAPTFSWTSEPPGFASDDAQIDVSPEQTTLYRVSIDNGQCPEPSVDSVLVRVSAPPLALVRSDTALCIGDTIRMGPGPIEAGVTYSWSGPAGVLDPGNPVSDAVPQASGVYELTADRAGCESEASFQVDVNTADVEILQGDTVFLCLDSMTTLEARLTGTDEALPITWTSDDPDFEPVVASSIEIMPTDSTIYRASIRSGVCEQVDAALVVVDSLPSDLGISPTDTTICEGQFVILETPAYETSDFPDIGFTWRPFRGQQSPDTLLNMVVTPDTTLTYYRITENGGCRDSMAAVITVNPIEQISIVPQDTTVCVGEQVQYRIQGPDGLEDIEWSPENGLSCTDCLNPVATAINTLTYNVQATFEDCPVDASANLSVVPAPSFNLTSQTVICPGGSVQLNNLFDPNATYTWTSTDPDFPENPGDATNPTVVVSPDETATYTLTADNGLCEPVTAEVTIQVVEFGELNLTATTTILRPGESATLTAELEGGTPIDIYTWTGTDGSTFTGPEITVTPQETTTYSVLVTVGPNCEQLLEEITINVFAVDVPNAFTPNGDGSNDRFTFTSSGDVGEVLRFQVFNRWGQVVYDNESAEGWDGQKNGNPQPSDVYAYIIVIRALDGEEVTFQGDVTLIR